MTSITRNSAQLGEKLARHKLQCKTVGQFAKSVLVSCTDMAKAGVLWQAAASPALCFVKCWASAPGAAVTQRAALPEQRHTAAVLR